MAPPFRSRQPKGPVIPRFDPKRQRREDPETILNHLSLEALFVLRIANTRQDPCFLDGYVARHLVEKKLLVRIPSGKKSLYRITFLGETVVEISYEKGIVTKGKVNL